MEKKKEMKRNNSMNPGCSGGSGTLVHCGVQPKVTNYLHVDNYENRLHQESQILQKILPDRFTWHLENSSALLADDPDSLENLMNSSPYFRELLKEKRVLFLSKKVFRIFHKWQYPEFYTSRNQLENKGLLELLNWRQVCSSWCSSLDQLLEEELIDCRGVSALGYNYGACGKIQMTKFLQHFQESHSTLKLFQSRSPFIGRYLPVRMFVDQSGEDCWVDLVQLMRTYGHHIWHLRYEASWEPAVNTPNQFYFCFNKILQWTPNLKSLLVHYSNADNLSEEIIACNGRSLPALVNLKMVKIGKAPSALFTNLLQTNSHITTLIVHFKEGYDCNVKLENLEELDVISRYPGGSFRKLVPPAAGNWPLRKLCWDDRDTETNISWKGAFKLISKTWANTLEELKLSLTDTRNTLHDSLVGRLNLPKVKIFELRVKENVAYAIDFLLGMYSLETVSISLGAGGVNLDSSHYRKLNKKVCLEAEKEQMFLFVGYEHRMYKSNVWLRLEKLMSLKVYQNMYLHREWIKSTELMNHSDNDTPCPGEPCGLNEDLRLSVDTEVLESLLPACCWDLVASSLADVYDHDSMEQLINSSPYFWKLLKHKRVLFLSNEVFSSFIFWKYPKGLNASHNQADNYKGLMELRQLGQVCSSWFFSDDRLSETLVDWYGISKLGESFALNNTAQVTNFLQHFQQSDLECQLNRRNPFIGGYLQVTFSFEEGQDLNEYFCLFHTYGLHIRNLSYGFSGNPVPGTPAQFYSNFTEMLEFLPYLRTLTLCYNCSTPNFTERIIRRHPLPRLMWLSQLNFVEVPPVLFYHMLRTYSHITSLVVNFKEQYNFNVKLEKLRDFSITSQVVDGNLKNFIPSSAGSWPIRWLRWYDNENEGGRQWGETFKIISDAWGTTLRELDINLPESREDEDKMLALSDSLNCRLHLPWVRRLELGVQTSACVFAFDFLLEMTFLDTVAIWSDVLIPKTRQGNKELIVEAEKKQFVQFVGYENKMYKSNIWTIFEKLETLTVYRKFYLRSEWLASLE